jgi:hypothetical protein
LETYPLLAAFLLFGSLWFWAASAVATIVLLALIEYEKPAWATTTFMAFLAVLAAFSNVNPFTWVAQHFVQFLEYLAFYLLIGVGWAVVKWVFFVMNRRDDYEKLRAEYLEAKSLDTVKDPKDFQDFLNRNDRRFSDDNYGEFPPKPQSNKSRIILWMAYWPWSATWTLINDPLKRFWRFAYQTLSGVLTNVSNAVFAKYRADLSQ